MRVLQKDPSFAEMGRLLMQCLNDDPSPGILSTLEDLADEDPTIIWPYLEASRYCTTVLQDDKRAEAYLAKAKERRPDLEIHSPGRTGVEIPIVEAYTPDDVQSARPSRFTKILLIFIVAFLFSLFLLFKR